MPTQSKINYLDYVINAYTWNCQKVSPGCKNCYAERLTLRFRKREFRGTPILQTGLETDFYTLRPYAICGINFMSDTWHEGVSLDTIDRVHQLIASRPDCVFIYTTKRSERLMENGTTREWPDNLWVGVSVENEDYAYRIDHLRMVPTDNRWVSFEPLLGPILKVDLTGIGWVVTGGESGDGFRYMDPKWALDIGKQAQARGIPWYHKQGNGKYPDQSRVLFGTVYDAVPEAFRHTKQPVMRQERLF